ncbi:response regulator [Cellulomonas marina]|uniref:DNA-binding response regulator, NarL/FixJ family, contains REC and HTH domains n=1 Tax=Cellulomonas marina TaxID=988821 RepID=A0A1I1ARS2_9CELL|nr:response regulator transcription factor [Cellulomonas marina]GIG30453.1 DNA-binding response regulator [Cellulomonas marina]SFB39040.1 DNA-binding response regulator, NarL/FixJ family, contains REC and HTH domains [Cellulomonas marina]
MSAPAPGRPVRVVLADDEAMVRAGLRMLIDGEPDVEVVGEAADGVAVVDVVARTRPDVVLMDIRMPRCDGLEAARRVLAAWPEVRVVMLTTFDEDEHVDAALSAGVSGFLLKVAPPEELLAAVRRVAAGYGHLDPAVTRRVIARFAERPRPTAASPRLGLLTERETDVLRLVGRGLSNAEVAAELYLGEATVKTHLGRVLTKLGLRDRPAAIAFAWESGLVG